MKKINVKKIGLKGDGSLETKSLQTIIDKYSDKNNFIYFPKGTYVLSTIYLKDNTHLLFASGCKILGSKNFYDFDEYEKIDYPLYQDQSHSFFNASLFVGKGCKNISFEGNATIDMQSVWDEDDVHKIVHRGCKCIALRECENVVIKDLKILNVTDLAVYFASCENVRISGLYLRVYIDGISPDNSKNVLIENCKVISGDDAIVFKSSYNLNKLDYCKNIKVRNCDLISRCNCIKFGTETNGGFYNIDISNITMKNTRITGISIESVDGAIIDNIRISNVFMKNVNAPLFIYLGKRMRGPSNLKIGSIKNIFLKNIKVVGPYKPYKTVAWNYISYKSNDVIQYPWIWDGAVNIANKKEYKNRPWQFGSNICGLKDHYLENIVLEDFDWTLYGNVKEFTREVNMEPSNVYPEVFVYGKTLPSFGLYVRYVKGLKTKNLKFKTLLPDAREAFIVD